MHMAVSGHKNEASIRSYSKTDICTKKKIMSETLTTRCEVSEVIGHKFMPVISSS